MTKRDREGGVGFEYFPEITIDEATGTLRVGAKPNFLARRLLFTFIFISCLLLLSGGLYLVVADQSLGLLAVGLLASLLSGAFVLIGEQTRHISIDPTAQCVCIRTYNLTHGWDTAVRVRDIPCSSIACIEIGAASKVDSEAIDPEMTSPISLHLVSSEVLVVTQRFWSATWSDRTVDATFGKLCRALPGVPVVDVTSACAE